MQSNEQEASGVGKLSVETTKEESINQWSHLPHLFSLSKNYSNLAIKIKTITNAVLHVVGARPSHFKKWGSRFEFHESD